MFRPSYWALLALLTLSAPPTFADSLLNGLALHKEFNKDLFIGALYTDNLSSDATAQLNSSGRKRLELRVTAKRLSSRQLNSMWIEGMAINNPPNLLTEQAQNMVNFTTFVKRSLRAGDILTIRDDATHTTVALNNVQLGTIDSPDFFNMVLRTWIGAVPLSSKFRDDLLTGGKVDGNLLAQFENIHPSEARQQAIAKWSQPAAAATAALAATADDTQEGDEDDSQAQPQAPAMDTGIAKPVLAAPAIAAPALAGKPAQEAPATEEATIASKDPTKPAAAQPATPAAEPAAPAAVAKAQPKASTPAEEALLEEEEFEDDEDSGPLLTAESLLSRQMYHSQLLRWTYKYIRYPKRAVSRGHEGSVRVAVVIDRAGKVKNVAEVESSKYDSLNREALNAVDRAKPFPPMPDTIKGNEFAFSLPIQFKLPD